MRMLLIFLVVLAARSSAPLRYCAKMTADECAKKGAQEKNPKTSLAVLIEACEMGSGIACAKFGFTETSRIGGDQIRGHRALQKACALGVPEACESVEVKED